MIVNKTAGDVVVSVPHSGTRTLVEYLGCKPTDFRAPGGRWWHFDFSDALLKKYPNVHMHVPIRDPMEVAASHARREKNIDRVIEAYNSMFIHLDKRAHTLYKMEDLPVLDGADDHDKKKSTHLIDEYKHIIQERVVNQHSEFFSQYY